MLRQLSPRADRLIQQRVAPIKFAGMDLGIAGRRAAVAASSAGLGYATAAALCEAGCEVVISGRNPERLARAAARLAGAHPVLADVSGPEGAERFVADAKAVLGPIDILVVNSGGPPDGGFGDFGVSDYAKAIDLNLLSVVAMCKSVVGEMRERGWGRILAITSLAVRQPIPGLILSNTARAGATGFLKTMAGAVAADGVTVNSIQPGLHATERLRQVWGDDFDSLAERVPTRTLGTPESFGRVAAFLCSDWARFITGAAVPVDGGMSQGLQ